ncbi:MAG TPA: CbiX/SirB N-terminal domain-containing protein [Gemmatimonadaceae bacterium]|nr:CbiX/SirB N-terminal domain-containing protein [Gemmatimonadaceae bacterium]
MNTTPRFLLGFLLSLPVLVPAPAESQGRTAAGTGPDVGTIVVAHGGDEVWNGLVRETVQSLSVGGPVEVSFLMGPAAPTHRFQDAVARLEAQGVHRIVVVPLLVSSHSGHYEQIRYLAGLTDSLDRVMRLHLHHGGIERPRTRVPIMVTSALDDAPELARALAERAVARADSPREQALLLVGHGPNSAEDYADWMANLRVVSDSVRAWTEFADVRVELVREDAPPPVRAEAVRRTRELIELQHRITQRSVVVVPILISRGGIPRQRILADLAGLPIVYGGEPVLPHAAIARWIESRVRAETDR